MEEDATRTGEAVIIGPPLLGWFRIGQMTKVVKDGMCIWTLTVLRRRIQLLLHGRWKKTQQTTLAEEVKNCGADIINCVPVAGMAPKQSNDQCRQGWNMHLDPIHTPKRTAMKKYSAAVAWTADD